MKKILLSLSVMLISISALTGQRVSRELTPEQKFLSSMHRNITSEKLYNYVVQLSDSTLTGRLIGTVGMEKAAAIVSDYFKDFGLEPLGDRGSYIQYYPNPVTEIHYGSDMSIYFPHKTNSKKEEQVWIEKKYPWADGWFAGNYSGNGEVFADVVYAGFGVSAPELGYDDYKGIDVKGKIVLIEGETPNRDRTPEGIAKWYKHTLHQTKMENAAKHGAIGLLYLWVPGPNSLYNPDLVYCHVTRQVVDDIFLGTGKSYKETVDKIYQEQKPQSFETGKKARIKMVSTHYPDATGKNIFGVVRGSDPELADEYIVVSAHLDHLGMIPYHIAGANDNNASSAVMLGVAEALAKSEIKPKRSVIFFSVDGEEAGLTGSTWYTNNPVVPKESVRAILNLEQMGAGERLGASYGYTYPGFEKYLNQANDSYVHRQLSIGQSTYRTRPRTDGAVFMKAGYPCVDLRASGGGFYHHPKDDVDSINPEMLQASAEYLYWLVILLANDENLELKGE